MAKEKREGTEKPTMKLFGGRKSRRRRNRR